jgi:hypothetical protein
MKKYRNSDQIDHRARSAYEVADALNRLCVILEEKNLRGKKNNDWTQKCRRHLKETRDAESLSR